MYQANEQDQIIVNLVERLQEFYQDFLKKAEKDLSIILLIGMTGAGKSTIFNLLSGAEFEFQEDYVNGYKLQVKSQNDQFSITKGGMISITKEPKYYFSQKYNHLLIDFPGFYDTRGSLDQLMVQLLFYKIVTTVPTKVVYVIRHPETHFSDRVVSQQQFIQQQFEEQQIEQQKLSLLLNSYNDKLNDDKLKVRVQKQLKEVYEKVNENIFVLRKVKNAETLSKFFSPESRDKLWEQIIQSNIIKFIPQQLPNSEIISQYLKETSSSKIKQYCIQLNNFLMNQVDNFICQNIQELKKSIKILISIFEKKIEINLTDWFICLIEAFDNIGKQLKFNYQCTTKCNNFIKILCFFSQFQNLIKEYSDYEKEVDSQCQQISEIICIKLYQFKQENQKEAKSLQNQQNSSKMQRIQIEQNGLQEINSVETRLLQAEQQLRDLRSELKRKEWIEDKLKFYIQSYICLQTYMKLVKQIEADYQKQLLEELNFQQQNCEIF